MLLNNHVKQSPIIGLAGMGGGIASYVFLSADGTYEIARSLRFDSTSSAYLDKTFGSAGNQKTWTWSSWIKRSVLGSYQRIFSAGSSSTVRLYATFTSSDQIQVRSQGGLNAFDKTTTAVYRDTSAWYHVVISLDCTNATASQRLRLYVNGVEVTSWSVDTNPGTDNANFNTTDQHFIGRANAFAASGSYFDGYMADVWFIDGQALEPTSFGKFDTTTGVWNPKRYTGTATGNSFHLPFTDTTSTTTLGYDDSGNSNNWTLNNIALGGTVQYSASGNWSTGNSTVQNPGKAFDGSIATEATCNYTTVPADDWLQWSYSLTASTSLRFYIKGGPISQNISINGLSSVAPSGNGRWLSLSEVYPGGSPTFPFSFSSIRITPASSSRAGRLGAVEVDGVVLSDPSQNDSLLDSPSNDTDTGTGIGGEITGNYVTWNPLTIGTYTNGNLDSTNTLSQIGTATIGVSSGKWYWEVEKTDSGTTHTCAGVTPQSYSAAPYLGWSGNGYAIYFFNGNLIYNSAGSGAYGAFSQGDILNVALDLDNGKLWFGKNGTWFNSGNPAAGTNALGTGLTETWYPGVSSASGTVTTSANFGQRDFAYDAPTGYKALNTAALPTPAIEVPSDYVGVTTYPGTLSAKDVVTGFQPDLVWVKNRDVAYSHILVDSVRGADNYLISDSAAAEGSSATITSFNSDGFGVSSSGVVNGNNMVAWTWKAGGNSNTFNIDGTGYSTASAAGLDGGSITPTGASVGTTQGFSIITYTASSTVSGTISHGLDEAPDFIILKRRNAGGTQSWMVGHTSLGWTTKLAFDTSSTAPSDGAYWNNTAPTSSLITLGEVGTNNTGDQLIYCWHDVPGLQKFGSFTGNADADGPFVELGFRPALIIFKNSNSAVTSWDIYDTARNPYNLSTARVFVDQNLEESNDYDFLDINSNGFKIRNLNAGNNGSGNTIIYAAWAETPFSTQARAR